MTEKNNPPNRWNGRGIDDTRSGSHVVTVHGTGVLGTTPRGRASETDVLHEQADPESALLGDAARQLAGRGVAVFPCRPGQKRPATRNGFKDATSDLEAVARWWQAVSTYNIGLPTGHGFDVIDVDPPHGADSLAQLEAAGLIPPVLMQVRTPRGGLHLYIRSTGDGCATGLMPGIDYRGIGGYVLAPPSRTEGGAWEIVDGGWENLL